MSSYCTVSFPCLCDILCLFSSLCCYDCGIHVARMISGVVRTRVSESLRWRDSSYTLDRACSYQAWVHTVLYLFSCLCDILCLFSSLCCYDCGIHVARMISGVVRTRVSESLRWRDSSYTLDRAYSCKAWVHTVLYLFHVFVTYCVCSVAFAVTIAVSMWRGWLVELFGLEFPRVFDDATALTLLTEPVHTKHEFILYCIFSMSLWHIVFVQ